MKSIALWTALALGCGLLAGCGKPAPRQQTVTPVRTAVVETIATTAPLRYSANIVPFTQVELGFKSGGVVEIIRQVRGADGRVRNVQEGDWVAKGTLLGSVRQEEYRERVRQAEAALAQSQAAYEKATLDWQRASALFATQSLTKPDFDSAKAQFDGTAANVDQAKAQLQQAEIALRDCSILAPLDAWVLQRRIEIGMVVNQLEPAFVLADTRAVKAVFGVPDLIVSQVRLGGRQPISVDAVPGSLEGRVTAISPAADPKSRVYSIEVTLPNARQLLRAGMIASLEFASDGAPLSRRTAVQLEAVVRSPQAPNAFAVFVTEGDMNRTVARVRAIEPGDAYGNRIVVLKGLQPGERVITTGATLVKDGDPVNIIP